MYLFDNTAYALGLFIISRFQVPGNFAETTHRIMQSELIYRMGLSGLLIGGLCTVFLAMGLYGALKPIDNNLALLALVFRVAEATLFGVLSIFSFSALKLYIAGDYRNAFGENQLSVLVNLSSVANSVGFNIAGIFFSVGSILFFYLSFKANYIPRILSASGLFATVLFSIVCFAALIWPQHARMLQIGWLPIGVAEYLVGFWLLFKGLNVRPQGN